MKGLGVIVAVLLLRIYCVLSFECKGNDPTANMYCLDYCRSLNPKNHIAGSCAKDEISCLCETVSNKTIKVRVLQEQAPKPYVEKQQLIFSERVKTEHPEEPFRMVQASEPVGMIQPAAHHHPHHQPLGMVHVQGAEPIRMVQAAEPATMAQKLEPVRMVHNAPEPTGIVHGPESGNMLHHPDVPRKYRAPESTPPVGGPKPQRLVCDGSVEATATCHSFCIQVVHGSGGVCSEGQSCRCKDISLKFASKEPIDAMYIPSSPQPMPPPSNRVGFQGPYGMQAHQNFLNVHHPHEFRGVAPRPLQTQPQQQPPVKGEIHNFEEHPRLPVIDHPLPGSQLVIPPWAKDAKPAGSETLVNEATHQQPPLPEAPQSFVPPTATTESPPSAAPTPSPVEQKLEEEHPLPLAHPLPEQQHQEFFQQPSPSPQELFFPQQPQETTERPYSSWFFPDSRPPPHQVPQQQFGFPYAPNRFGLMPMPANQAQQQIPHPPPPPPYYLGRPASFPYAFQQQQQQQQQFQPQIMQRPQPMSPVLQNQHFIPHNFWQALLNPSPETTAVPTSSSEPSMDTEPSSTEADPEGRTGLLETAEPQHKHPESPPEHFPEEIITTTTESPPHTTTEELTLLPPANTTNRTTTTISTTATSRTITSVKSSSGSFSAPPLEFGFKGLPSSHSNTAPQPQRRERRLFQDSSRRANNNDKCSARDCRKSCDARGYQSCIPLCMPQGCHCSCIQDNRQYVLHPAHEP